MLVKTYSAAVMGLEATTVTVEVSMSRGVMFHLTGLADTAVRESHDRIVAAMQNNGFKFPVADITINMAPADIKKEGSHYDLPLAVGVLAASNKIECEHLAEYMLIGELGLDGQLQPVRGALPIAIKAREGQFKGLIVPKQNAREAAVVNQLDVYGMENLLDVIEFLNGTREFLPTVVDTRKEFYEHQSNFEDDFADVRGQENVKRALEVAAAHTYFFAVERYLATGSSYITVVGIRHFARSVDNASHDTYLQTFHVFGSVFDTGYRLAQIVECASASRTTDIFSFAGAQAGCLQDTECRGVDVGRRDVSVVHQPDTVCESVEHQSTHVSGGFQLEVALFGL